MADLDEIFLWLPDIGEQIKFFEHYTYTSEFLSPTDNWSFTTGDIEVIRSIRSKVKQGSRVSLVINDRIQSTGIVDRLDAHSTRDGGNELTISGRDTMAPIEDACVDPRINFTAGDSIKDVLTKILPQFGFTLYSTSNLFNRNAITGNDPKKTFTTTKSIAPATDFSNEVIITEQHDPSKPKFLKDLTLQNFKPHQSEGAYEFLERMLKRFSLHMWADASGEGLIIGAPDFDQAPTYTLTHRLNDQRNNILTSQATKDFSKQTSIIIGTGVGGGGNFAKTTLKAAIVNELTGYDDNGNLLPAVQAILNDYKIKTIIAPEQKLFKYTNEYQASILRPSFLYDEECKTPGQLEGVLRRAMAGYQYKSMEVRYTMEGHTQNGKAYAVDTVANVEDDFLDIHEPMWIGERTFTKSKSGTMTHLTLHRLFTLKL